MKISIGETVFCERPIEAQKGRGEFVGGKVMWIPSKKAEIILKFNGIVEEIQGNLLLLDCDGGPAKVNKKYVTRVESAKKGSK